MLGSKGRVEAHWGEGCDICAIDFFTWFVTVLMSPGTFSLLILIQNSFSTEPGFRRFPFLDFDDFTCFKKNPVSGRADEAGALREAAAAF